MYVLEGLIIALNGFFLDTAKLHPFPGILKLAIAVSLIVASRKLKKKQKKTD